MSGEYGNSGREGGPESDSLHAKINEAIEKIPHAEIKSLSEQLSLSAKRSLDLALNLVGWDFYALGQCQQSTNEKIIPLLQELRTVSEKDRQDSISQHIAELVQHD